MSNKKHKRTLGSITSYAHTLGLKLENRAGAQWTEQEDNLIKQYFNVIDIKLLQAKLTHRTLIAIKTRAHVLGLATRPDNSWTEDEDNILKEYYLNELKDIMNRLPNRAWSAIQARARELNLKIGQWTVEENEILKQYFPIEGSKIANRLPSRSIGAIKAQAVKLNIKYQGHWTDNDIEILKQYYPIEGLEVFKRLPGKSIATGRVLVSKLGLRLDGYNWGKKKIKCVETGEIFNSIKDAEEIYNTSTIKLCLRGGAKTAVGYHWEYVDKANKGELSPWHKKHSKKVCCIETNEIFDSINAAASKYKVNIKAALCGKAKTAGKLPDGTKLHWKYVDEENKDK